MGAAVRRILGITGIRSDYDLASSLYKRLAAAKDFDFRMLVGGAHLSWTYGHTIDLIRADGVPILACVESLIDGDTPSSRIKTASTMLQGSIDVVASWDPDLIIYCGDREEVWLGALLGAYLEVPSVHMYGGDHTATGHVDNPVRHATSKLSTVHFVALPEHRERLIAIGESECRIFVTGNMSLDNFISEPSLPPVELAAALGVPTLPSSYALVLFHPDPSEKEVAAGYLREIIEAVIAAGLTACIGYPNTDPSNRGIIEVIEGYAMYPNVISYRSLARQAFISLYRRSEFIIGNSSSGIIEAASIPRPAINVGLRQRGRLASGNVVFCDGDSASISGAIARVMEQGFQIALKEIENPYGDGQAAARALEFLRTIDFSQMRLKIEDPLRSVDSQTAQCSASSSHRYADSFWKDSP